MSAAAPAEIRAALRARRPLVHCLTNAVTAGRVADALAAAGALPIMASAAEEAEEVTAAADALLLNCGTPSEARWRAMRIAARVAAGRGIPVVLDPVGCASSAWRLARARELAAMTRPIVRGNAAEVAALAGIPSSARPRGVTAVGATPAEVERVAAEAALALGTTVLVTGAADAVADGMRVASDGAASGAAASVVGLGDVLGALVAACAAVVAERFDAAWCARTLVAGAARRASAGGAGPGSFWGAFLDALGAAT